MIYPGTRWADLPFLVAIFAAGLSGRCVVILHGMAGIFRNKIPNSDYFFHVPKLSKVRLWASQIGRIQALFNITLRQVEYANIEERLPHSLQKADPASSPPRSTLESQAAAPFSPLQEVAAALLLLRFGIYTGLGRP